LACVEQAATRWNRRTLWATRAVVFSGQKISSVVLVNSSPFSFPF